jgi:glycerol kinase
VYSPLGLYTRLCVFAAETSQLVTFHQVQVELQSPHKGWVEQDPQELLDSSITCINSTVDKLNKLSVDIVCIGAEGDCGGVDG